MKKYEEIIKAYKNGYAIPQFNTIDAEYTRYILEECEKEKSPVILGVSEKVANHLGGFKVARNIVDALIEELNITVPVILHLDHAKSKESCEKAINAGFDSVMLDYSSHPLEENIKITKSLVLENPNTIIECEVGTIGKNGNEGIVYSDIIDIEKIKRETNAHLIAPSFGTVHGVYKGEPKLNFELLDEIRNKIDTPLVMHGGSGLSDENFKKSIAKGVAKININTELKQAWTKSIRKFLNDNPNETDPVFIIQSTSTEIKKVVSNLIHVFGSNNKA